MKLAGGAPEHTIALRASLTWQAACRATATGRGVAVVELWFNPMLENEAERRR